MAKILLVEDDKSLREIYGVRLLAEGYDIVSAGDGEEALAVAIKDRPDLILSDVMMPKISGFDMLDILRSTTETRDVKVIMMTALSSDDQRERGEKLGADRYLVKSQVGIEDVVRTVHEVLGDAPTTSAPSFASTRPNSASDQQSTPTPATPVAEQSAPEPPTIPAPAPQPIPVQQAVPDPAPQPAPASVQQPMAASPIQPPATPTQPPTPEQPSGLPQPTAPFSTDRPANFGDRVVHPPEHTEEQGDPMSSRIEQELSSAGTQPAPLNDSLSTVPAPAPPSAPDPVPAPQSQPNPAVHTINVQEDPSSIEQELAEALAGVSQDTQAPEPAPTPGPEANQQPAGEQAAPAPADQPAQPIQPMAPAPQAPDYSQPQANTPNNESFN